MLNAVILGTFVLEFFLGVLPQWLPMARMSSCCPFTRKARVVRCPWHPSVAILAHPVSFAFEYHVVKPFSLGEGRCHLKRAFAAVSIITAWFPGPAQGWCVWAEGNSLGKNVNVPVICAPLHSASALMLVLGSGLCFKAAACFPEKRRLIAIFCTLWLLLLSW